MKIDMHVHTTYSGDSLIKPKQLLEKAKALGIGFAVTEHDNAASWKELKRLNKEYKVPIIFGEEVYCVDGDGKEVGELLCLFLKKEIKPGHFLDVIKEAKKQGGIVSVAHPFSPLKLYFKRMEQIAGKIDAVETLNARVPMQSSNEKAGAFAEKHSLAQTAGSDCHTIKFFGKAFVECNAKSVEEFKKKLLRGQCRVGGEKIPFWEIALEAVYRKIAKNRV